MVNVVIFILIIVALLFSLGFFKHPTTNSTNSQTVSRVRRVKPLSVFALGDSLTQGVGDTKDLNGYQQRLKDKIIKDTKVSHVQMYNAGVSGERSDQILKRLKRSKALQAEVKSSDILILTAGGNDLLQTLQKNAQSPTSEVKVAVNKTSLTYQNNLKQIFDLSRKLNPKIRLVMVGVYNPVFVYFPNVTMITDSIKTMNDTATATINGYQNATFVDINGLSNGQFQTAKQLSKLKQSSDDTNETMIDSKEFDQQQNNSKEKNNYLSNADHFHPNDKGYNFMTKQIYQQLKQKDFLTGEK